MLGVASCDECIVKPKPLSCILDLLVDGICKDLYKWLFDLGLGAGCGMLLDEVVILCCIDIFYMAHMLRRVVSCTSVGYNLERIFWK
jgi:hypothetical protein